MGVSNRQFIQQIAHALNVTAGGNVAVLVADVVRKGDMFDGLD